MISFNFSDGLKSFFLNPNYIIRKWLYKEILWLSPYLQWKIMDFWCWEKPYKNLFKSTEYIGVDMKVSGHDNSQNQIDIFWDWKNIPIEDDFFDWFLATEVLEHVFNIDEILDEIYRVLKTGGYGIITIPFMIGEHEEPYDFARYTYFWIQDILQKHGFTIVEHKRLGTTYSTLLQLIRWYIAQIVYSSNNKILQIFLNIILWLPTQLIINILSLLDFSKNQKIYLNNCILVQKNDIWK